jgi:hypothetical protein
MPNVAFSHSSDVFDIRPDQRLCRLQECARYCRRLAQQSDRPSAFRSLVAIAAEFEAQADRLMMGGTDAANDAELVPIAAAWQI